MTQRPTKLLHIDGIAHPVPEPVWAHFRFLSAQLASMANHATKQAARVKALEAGRFIAPPAVIIATRFDLPLKPAEVVVALLRAGGEFVQSPVLAEACGSTVNALSVHAFRARAAGIEVIGHRKRGYRLSEAAMEKEGLAERRDRDARGDLRFALTEAGRHSISGEAA